jgi:hypothetical protein
MPEAQPELHVFTFGLRPGDRITRADAREWEVADPPETYQGGKMVRVRLRRPGDTTVTDVEYWPAYQRVKVKRRRPGGEVAATRATVSTRTELLVRDGDGKLVYRFTLSCDPVANPAYLEALVAGQQVSAIACERPGTAQVFYAKTLDELRAWAARVRSGDGWP